MFSLCLHKDFLHVLSWDEPRDGGMFSNKGFSSGLEEYTDDSSHCISEWAFKD